MSCPWIIAMISTGYLTQAWGILAIMSVTSVVIGNIVRTELADIFVHFSVRGRQFSDIAISKYINGFNVFSKTTCDPDAIYSDLLQRRCGQRGKLPVLSLIQVWHHPHTSHQRRLQQSVNIVSPGCGLTPCSDPSDAPLWKLAVRLHLKEAAGHGSALTFDLCLSHTLSAACRGVLFEIWLLYNVSSHQQIIESNGSHLSTVTMTDCVQQHLGWDVTVTTQTTSNSPTIWTFVWKQQDSIRRHFFKKKWGENMEMPLQWKSKKE